MDFKQWLSEAMAAEIDESEIKRIIDDAFQKTGEILVSGEDGELSYKVNIPTFEGPTATSGITMKIKKENIKSKTPSMGRPDDNGDEFLSVNGFSRRSTLAVTVNILIDSSLWFTPPIPRPQENQYEKPNPDPYDDYGFGATIFDSERFQQALQQYQQKIQPIQQRMRPQILGKWQQVRPEFYKLVRFILSHELGHGQRSKVRDPNYHLYSPFSDTKTKNFTDYQRSGKEWDANFYAIRSAFGQLTPRQKRSMTYDQFVQQALPQAVYNRYMISPKWKNAVISRMSREGMVLGR